MPLPRLQPGAIVDPKTGHPTMAFTLWWRELVEAQEATDAAQDQLIEETSDLLANIILLNELITEAEEAIEEVNVAVASVQAVADAANALIADIEAGNLELEAVNIGGVRFVNNGGVLEPEVP